ncbi:hypothetical protein M3O96_16490 [Aquiflexum sp. TKW24L]|uniref:hypothetical protein n=1 Tax=Aquiflexum sp. TKW24L TaxID=2942212 RepID=UPI0020BE4002|nr:hypothetical protein [Aquiflexum sp. TKW24L]MCL6260705.1 hypothetical protein [Aquiflexum sp. TKW24L]
MKSRSNSIKIFFFFSALIFLNLVFNSAPLFAQGFNNNEWIFGDCGTGQNNILSFGKGENPIVRNLPSGVIVGQNNNAVAIDPISGNIIFYTNGVLVYDANDQILEGVAPGINGNINGQQELAIGVLSYDPAGDRLYYIFYLSPTGDLQYALIDMNAPGQAVGNEPPLGEILVKDQLIAGTVSGPIMVVKTPQSPSYLISIEGGTIVSRRIGENEGEFIVSSNVAIPFTPKSMVFDEDSQKIILIPEDPNENIVILDFDAATGTFSNITPILESSNGNAFGGAAYSEDGDFIYFSRGNELVRVPASDLTATPEIVPLENDIFQIYDIKTGPDGRLYYIYEEVDGGPQLIGRVENPDVADLAEIELEEDPFNGTDFCGRIFPQFAPNQNIDATVDFEWNPEEPCSNNPIQLTSLITPENFQPVSFEWTFNPPLTDEDGQEIDIDFTQEHLLIPEEATANESISVTLTVTFADGTTQTVDKTITLLPNDLQVQFSAQDTTVCEGGCVDIGSMLTVQSGDGQGGGGGGGEVYEYFWSNIREWRPTKDNCVDLPGLYWVLVREPGSECYAYGSVRVKIWDLNDQSNNIWYFGDGAGLDFNPDPNNPNGPTPRAVGHNQNIPAGTTTISDGTGQVLFFTDGETVWDLNGDVMENGDSIGGSNLSSQSVLAVPVPQDETIFYLFTTQTAVDGSNQVKFSVVDIKVENPNGVGNVVSKDNFLFSPSTEHSAALAAGDTTWVLFHELGNNTFRAYPVSIFGIGSPVFSSVGSNHGFNTGVGTMKFSPDGTKVAVTLQDGACSKMEIFDFDPETGVMTEYALVDLGCNNEQIYGLEFSPDGSRVFVSYRGGSGKVEEFLIQAPEQTGTTALACATCFENATSRSEREACILNSPVRGVLSTSGPFGALQIGPDGQIYVARPGQNMLGSINAGTDCVVSIYNEMGSPPLTGTSNLGLPSFVQQSGSSIPDPLLAGPIDLCLDLQNGTLGSFEGGGEPDIDSYFWTITHEDGTVELNNFGGPGDQFQFYDHLFTRPGLYTVDLRVGRCGDPDFYEGRLEVMVIAPPVLTLPESIILCLGTPVSLTAIEGYDPIEGLYNFEWRNAAGQLFGDQNSNTIFVNEESIFTVVVSYRPAADDDLEFFNPCPSEASVFVGPAFEFDLTQTDDQVCYDENLVIFAPNTPISGQWFYQVQGTVNRVPLGEFFELNLVPSTLPSPGVYDIIFVTEDPIVPGCIVEKQLELIIFPFPAFEVVVLTDADDCDAVNGSFEITMLADADEVRISQTGQLFTNVFAGDVLPVITGLEPGVYTVAATSENGCQFLLPVVVQNLNPPIGISDYEVTANPETCSATGVDLGSIDIVFNLGPQSGSYILIRQEDGQEFTGTFTLADSINIPLMDGTYSLSMVDLVDCTFPDPVSYVIDNADQVVFSVPTNVTACGLYILVPQSQIALNYEVRGPNGQLINADQDGGYLFEFTGVYTVKGFDPEGVLCPSELSLIQAVINSPIDFSLTSPIVDCDLGVSYQVVLFGFNPNNANFLWRNAAGVIVGRNQEFFPPSPGIYTVEVQPRSGGLCPEKTIEFEVEEFLENLEVNVTAQQFCEGDTFANISVEADLTNVSAIQWFTVVNAVRTPLPNSTDQETVTVFDVGVYEVVLLSVYGCEIAREQVQISRSVIVPPVLAPSYTICAVENVTVELRPGTFDFYSWILDGTEVSTDSVFVPTLLGSYLLTVSDNLGCEFTVSFLVVEDCALRVVFPEAMVPSKPDRHFLVYTNDFVDELEVFIYNRWGELIFYCEQKNINAETFVCSWDGSVNGTFVPIGVYPVVVNLKSNRQNVTKRITKSILVIE